MRFTILSFVLLFSSFVSAQNVDSEEIEERIRPIGQINIEEEGANPANAKVEPPKPVEVSNPGQKIYEKYCVVCHDSGVAGSPKFRNETDWKPRQDKRNIDLLTATAIKGLNAMPPKGTCQECNEADIKAAIQYMVPQS